MPSFRRMPESRAEERIRDRLNLTTQIGSPFSHISSIFVRLDSGIRRNDEQNQVRLRDNPLWLSYLFVDNLGNN